MLFRHQSFVDTSLGALDLAGSLCFLDHMHFDEKIDVRHDQRKGIQFTQCSRGLFQQYIDGRIFPTPFAVDQYRLETLVLIALPPVTCFEGFDFHAASRKVSRRLR